MIALPKPDLPWIDIDIVIDIARKRFDKSAERITQKSTDTLRVEPTLAIVRAGLTGEPLSNSDEIDLAIGVTKTIQNAVGLFHQDILGSASGWESRPTGGLIDLIGKSPVTGSDIIAELKMRYNTIKASDEKRTWDALKDAAAVNGKNTTAYIFQIVPKTNVSYDIPWKVTAREPSEKIRCADGVTAYHIVTGYEDALFQLIQAMPYVTAQISQTIFGDNSHAQLAYKNSSKEVERLFNLSLPAKSALSS